MKKIYCVIFEKHRKFKILKISYILDKTIVLSIICSKCENEVEEMFQEEESIEILKFLGLIKNV